MRAQEYTPTTENIRDCYVYSKEMYDGSMSVPVLVSIREFDRWLAGHDRKVQAEALREAAKKIRHAESVRQMLEARATAIENGEYK